MRTIVSKTLGGDLLGSKLQLIDHYPATLKDEGQSLRPIIMWFHSYLERERALTAARQKYQDEKRNGVERMQNLSSFLKWPKKKSGGVDEGVCGGQEKATQF